ncbi:MAG: ABC transporter permease [Candidatus Methanomethyliaceae archaeon]
MLRNPKVAFGLSYLLLLSLIALLAPYVSPYPPNEINPEEALAAPSFKHLFGTDGLGRDIFSRVLYGARYSLPLGLVAVAIATSAGCLFGVLAGYCGGIIDGLIMRCVDIALAFPTILLGLLVISVTGPGLTGIVLAVGVASAPSFIRVVRGSVLVIRQMVYVEAARAIGVGFWRLLVRHVLPQTVGPVVTMATLGLAQAIFATSSLSFLGLGARPPTPEWGVMVSAARHQLSASWWASTFPGIAITVTVLAINLLGDGLRDALDPRLRGKVIS